MASFTASTGYSKSSNSPFRVGLVGHHIEMSVARQVEQDHTLLAFGLGIQGFVDRHADGVGRFGRRMMPSALVNITAAWKVPIWRNGHRINVAGIA